MLLIIFGLSCGKFIVKICLVLSSYRHAYEFLSDLTPTSEIFFLALEGYRLHFDVLFPFLNGSLTSSESNMTSDVEGNQSSKDILEDKPVITDDVFPPTISTEMSGDISFQQTMMIRPEEKFCVPSARIKVSLSSSYCQFSSVCVMRT